jgi:hypothetical protein
MRGIGEVAPRRHGTRECVVRAARRGAASPSPLRGTITLRRAGTGRMPGIGEGATMPRRSGHRALPARWRAADTGGRRGESSGEASRGQRMSKVRQRPPVDPSRPAGVVPLGSCAWIPPARWRRLVPSGNGKFKRGSNPGVHVRHGARRLAYPIPEEALGIRPEAPPRSSPSRPSITFRTRPTQRMDHSLHLKTRPLIGMSVSLHRRSRSSRLTFPRVRRESARCPRTTTGVQRDPTEKPQVRGRERRLVAGQSPCGP